MEGYYVDTSLHEAVSVGVSCFTLVTLSAERYFAICHPLKSRTWQTLSHAYKTIILIWLCALFLMVPIAAAQEVIPLRTGYKACREIWADNLESLQITYSVFLSVVLLLIPLIIMIVAYGAISFSLWFNMKQQMQDQESTDTFISSNNDIHTSLHKRSYNGTANISLRQTNVRSTNTYRKRVIKMLCVVVLEYFVCCSPLYILNTWKVIDYYGIHTRISDTAWSMILLLFYVSSCIHPITFCFMNKNFRKSFLSVFHCFLSKTKPLGRSCTEMTSINSSANASRKNRLQKQSTADMDEF